MVIEYHVDEVVVPDHKDVAMLNVSEGGHVGGGMEEQFLFLFIEEPAGALPFSL